jgi:3-dehydroquinate synthase
VKYGLIGDPDFFAWCEANGAALLRGSRSARCADIEHCILAKARFVAEDPDDTKGRRALLNFGHTFGHAIEAVAGHALLHGEAVTIGMVLAAGFSVELGHCGRLEAERIRSHFQAVGLPIRLADAGIDSDAVLEVMQSDKKATSAGMTLILLRGIGRAFVSRDVELPRLKAFLGAAA